jgi:hypothetical protein
MLSQTACAITPNSTTDRVLSILGQALVAKSASGGYDYRQGLRDSQDFVNNNPAMRMHEEATRQMMRPNFGAAQCSRVGNTIQCIGQQW